MPYCDGGSYSGTVHRNPLDEMNKTLGSETTQALLISLIDRTDDGTYKNEPAAATTTTTTSTHRPAKHAQTDSPSVKEEKTHALAPETAATHNIDIY